MPKIITFSKKDGEELDLDFPDNFSDDQIRFSIQSRRDRLAEWGVDVGNIPKPEQTGAMRVFKELPRAYAQTLGDVFTGKPALPPQLSNVTPTNVVAATAPTVGGVGKALGRGAVDLSNQVTGTLPAYLATMAANRPSHVPGSRPGTERPVYPPSEQLAQDIQNRLIQRNQEIQDWGTAFNEKVLPQSEQTKRGYLDLLGEGAIGTLGQKLAEDTARMAVPFAPALVASLATGGAAAPVLAGVMGGTQEGLGQFNEALAGGKSPEEAAAEATAFGALTIPTNMIPFLRGLTSKIAPEGASLLRRSLARLLRGAAEGVTEVAEGGLQPLAEADLPLRELPRAVAQGLWDESSVFPAATLTGLAIGGGAAPATQQVQAKPSLGQTLGADVSGLLGVTQGKPETTEVKPPTLPQETPAVPAAKPPTGPEIVPPAPAEVAPAPVAQGKEPWRMTRSEYSLTQVPQEWRDRRSEFEARAATAEPLESRQGFEYTSGEKRQILGAPDTARMPLDALNAALKVADKRHHRLVEEARDLGKPVPPEVLAEYPDLQPKPTEVSRNAVPRKEGQEAPQVTPETPTASRKEPTTQAVPETPLAPAPPIARVPREVAVDDTNQAVKEFRSMVRDRGIRPLRGSMTTEDFGGGFPPGLFRRAAKTTWDQWGQEAVEMGLLEPDHTTNEFRDLLVGKNKNVRRYGEEREAAAVRRGEVEPPPSPYKFPVNEPEMDPGDLLYRNGEWHKVEDLGAEGKRIVDGETINVAARGQVGADRYLKVGEEGYTEALQRFREQEVNRMPVEQTDLLGEPVVPQAEAAVPTKQAQGDMWGEAMGAERMKTKPDVPGQELLPGATNVSGHVKAAIRNVAKGISEALGEDFGSERGAAVNPFDPGNPDPEAQARYKRVKQHFAAAWTESKAAGADIKTFVDEMLRTYGEKLRPYIVRFQEEIASETAAKLAQPSPTPAVGRPDLAIPVTSEPARELIRTVDDFRGKYGQPEVWNREQIEQDADALVGADPESARRMLLERGQSAGQMNDAETALAKRILERDALDAMAGGTEAQKIDAARLADSYRRTGTVQSRAFRMRYDPNKSPADRAAEAVTEAIMQPSKKIRKQLDKIEDGLAKIKDPAARARLTAEKEKLFRQQAHEMTNLYHHLELLGVDVNNLRQEMQDKYKAAQIYREVSAFKADNWDALHEYWISYILSGPRTHAANIIGNTASTVWDFTFQRGAEMLVNLAAKDPGSAQFDFKMGEAKEFLRGILPGLARARVNSLASWRTERPMFEDEVGGTMSGQKIEHRGAAISGKKGRVIRTSLRALMVEDEFQKSIIGQMEAGAQAHRIAKAEGLEGEARVTRIAELVDDLGSEAWRRAAERARYLTFQTELGPMGKWISQGMRDVPFLRYIVPFIKAPTNIFKMGLRKTPLGSLRMAAKWRDPAYSKTMRVHDVAEQLLAWGTFAAIAGLMDDDDGNPRITGTEGPIKQSIRINGKWYSYARIEPMAVTLATDIDMINAIKAGRKGMDVADDIGRFYSSFVEQAKDKTFMQGIGDIIEALRDEKSATRWAADFATSLISPNVVKQTARATDPYIREQRIYGAGEEFYRRLANRMKYAALPIAANAPQPKVNIWGEDIKKDVGVHPASDFLYRVFVPVDTRDPSEQLPLARQLDRLILNWNNQNPQDQWLPRTPATWYKVDGKTKYYADEEYHRYCKLAGEGTLKEVGNAERPYSFDNPTELDINRLKKVIERSRAWARAQVRR